jgi:chromo domain-containing protein 1
VSTLPCVFFLADTSDYRCEKTLTHIADHFMLCVLTETGTWEPEEGLKDTGLLEPWNRAKDRMGSDAFAKFKEAQEVEFYRAHRRHHMGKPIRKEKRARKRDMMKTLKRSRPLKDVSDSEDDTPLMQTRPARSSKGQKPGLAAPASQSSYYDNFVDSQDPDPLSPPPAYQPSESGLFVAESNRMRRKVPLTQSEDEESSSVNSDSADSLMGELADSAKSDAHKRKSKANPGPDLGHSVLSPKRPRKKASAPSEKPVSKQPVANVSRHEEPPIPFRKLTAPVAAMVPKVTQLKKPTAQSGAPAVQTSSPALRRKSIGTVNMSESSTTAAARTTTKVTNAAKPTIAGVPSRSTGPTAIRRTGGSSKSSIPAIKFKNEPRTQQRKPWQHGEDRQYNKLHFRAVAQKRSQTESAPNVDDLDFVGPAPAGSAKSRAADDNPYGRRETGSRRVQEPDSYETRRRDSNEDTTPLEDYEAKKSPLVCPHWRLANNCRYGQIKCNFLHRNKDENGKDIPVGDMSGVMPPKFRKPALTCLYWLNNEKGCRKPDVECIYAHKNTGWVPKDMNNNQPVQIDPSALPVSALSTKTPRTSALMPQIQAGTPQDKRRMRPSELTCWFWTQGRCHNMPETCTFKHYDTGVIAEPPPCRFWLQGICKKSAEQCIYPHRDTGIVDRGFVSTGEFSSFPNDID